MEIALLHVENCPNVALARGRVDEALERAGVVDAKVVERLVTSRSDGEAVGFHGSPTILIDGRDPFSAPAGPVDLACRLFSTPEGLQGSPAVAELIDAIRS